MKTNIFAKAIALATLALSFNAAAFAAPGNDPSDNDSSASTRSILYEYDHVNSNTTDVWTVTLHRGETFIVEVIGDGDTDLDLYVYDENDNLIDKDIELDDHPVCIVSPKWTGTFRIKIKNRGNVYNNYLIEVY